MIEKTVLDYLTGALTDPVYVEKPESPPARYHLVQQTGGGARGRLFTAMVAVQSYAESRYEAGLMNDGVIAAMDGLPALPEIAGCRLNAAYPFPDPERKEHRFQAVFDITHY